MDLRLSAHEQEIQRRSRRFCDDFLLPVEVLCDEQDGLTPEQLAPVYRGVLDARLNAVNKIGRAHV